MTLSAPRLSHRGTAGIILIEEPSREEIKPMSAFGCGLDAESLFGEDSDDWQHWLDLNA